MRRKVIKIDNEQAIEYADGLYEDIFSPEWLKAYEDKVKELITKNKK